MLDNELNDGMIINRKYVLAHTPNICLRKATQNSGGGLGGFEQFIAEGILGVPPADREDPPPAAAGDIPRNNQQPAGAAANNNHATSMVLVLMELGLHDHLQV